MGNKHPAPEDLLLWQSGELDGGEAAAVGEHVAGCPQCRARLETHARIYAEIARASGSFGAGRGQPAAAARSRAAIRLSRIGMATVAAALIVAVSMFTLDLTPSARADTLLRNAARQQSLGPGASGWVRIQSGGAECRARLGAPATGAALPDSRACAIMADQLRRVGWTASDVLSARSFAAWRKSRRRKADAVHKLPLATEIKTTTDDGPLREAMLRLRNADWHPVAAHYEFAASGAVPGAAMDVEEMRGEAPAAPPAPPAAPGPKEIPPPDPATAGNLLDETEAKVRLALHQAALDGNILLAVEREPDSIKVWGVVPTDEAKASLTAALQGLRQVRVEAQSEHESWQTQRATPWTAYHGDAPPLEAGQLAALFQDNPQGREEFLNEVDAMSRGIAGKAKSRDELLALAARMPASAYAPRLRGDAADFQDSLATEAGSLAGKLRRAIPSAAGPDGRATHPLSYPQAMQLYTAVHELVFAARSQDGSNLGDALATVRRLLPAP